jgi:hypothetical protein
MLFKMKVQLAAVAAFIVVQSANLFAIELPNMEKITVEDNIYFGSRLDVNHLKKLLQIVNHTIISRSPCEKAAEIKKNLRFIKEVKPIFQEASRSAYISSYARKYSAVLAQELTETSKALNEILPHYKDACAVSTVSQK